MVFDTETKELIVLEKIVKVRVWSGGDMRVGDFNGGGGEVIDGKMVGTRKGAAKPRKCGKCGKPGHRREKCTEA